MLSQSYLFLDLLRGVVSCIEQGLASFISGSKTVLVGINLSLGNTNEKLTNLTLFLFMCE